MLYKEIDEATKHYIIELFKGGQDITQVVKQSGVCADFVIIILTKSKSIPKGFIKLRYVDRSSEWKDSIVDYYRTNTRYETAAEFCCSAEIVKRVLQERGVELRSHSEELTLIKEKQFGSVEAYKEHIHRKTVETSLKRYGVTNFAKSLAFRDKAVTTSLQKYGTRNPMQNDEIKQRLQETVQNRYGVPWFCMTDKARRSSRGADSTPNLNFYSELLKYFNADSITREFTLDNFVYDFKLGDILIEVNPTATHNSTWGIYNEPPRDSSYHKFKTEVAQRNGYRCIHIWDWDDITKVIKLLLPRNTVYARQCCVQEVSLQDSRAYLAAHHLQGYARDAIRIGLYFQEELVSIMTFAKPRYSKKYQYELIRYCSHYNVVGGAKKLFNYFVKTYEPTTIVSYCDSSKFEGCVYSTLGFERIAESVGKHWYNMKTHKHITDGLLRQRGFDQLLGNEYGCFGKGTSNEELMKNHDFVEVYDAGQITYLWCS